MDTQLVSELAQVMLQSRHLAKQVLNDNDITIAELIALGRIANNAEDSVDNVYADDLQDALHVSKPAISQMFKSLEARGYIKREINLLNRRKLIIILTDKGREALAATKTCYADILAEIIDAFGEDKTRQMIALFEEFSGVIRGIARERMETPIPKA